VAIDLILMWGSETSISSKSRPWTLILIVSVHWFQMPLPSRSGTLSSTSICGGLRSVLLTSVVRHK